MMKFINSLQTKLMASFLLLIVVIAGGVFSYTFAQTKSALYEITKDDVLQMVGMAASQLTPQDIDAISRFEEGQDDSPEYLAMKERLVHMRSMSPSISNFYIMRIEGENVTFLLDDADEDFAMIGEPYEDHEPILLDAVDGPQASEDFYTDKWGSFLSGYVPVKNADGETAFVLGADMDASAVIERQNFIGNTIYFIIGLGILIAAAIIGLFSITIIKDIKKLNFAAEKISKGDTNIRVDVKRKDEIGELADSFGRMVASLKIMMAEDEGQNESPESSKRK